MNKTNIGLVDYCKAMLGKPYWMGTFGQIANKSLYDYNKSRLPKYYTATDFTSQFGQPVHDCIGLIKGYLWRDSIEVEPKYCSNNYPDISADEMRKRSNPQDIATIPDIVGILVFYTGHVGVYIGNGEVIEARGHNYGVVKTKLKDRCWKWWGKCPYIDYQVGTKEEAIKWAKELGIDISDLDRTITLRDLIKISYGGKQ